MTAVVSTRSELAEARRQLSGRVAVVMTMGALHQGHLALIARGHELADHVIVTIFVNPLQFSAGEDFARYPRDLGADVALLAEAGVALVFAPSEAQMYPVGRPAVHVSAGPRGDVLEGLARPGHFDGVLTVVALLLHLVRPDVAVFGRKDGQQLALVRLMVDDLAFAVAIEGVDTVRDDDGLARSSRNAYLSHEERVAARAVPRALHAAAGQARDHHGALRAARRVLLGAAGVDIDYLAVVDPDTFEAPDAEGEALLVVAVRIGETRLIDNIALSGPTRPGGEEGSETIVGCSSSRHPVR